MSFPTDTYILASLFLVLLSLFLKWSDICKHSFIDILCYLVFFFLIGKWLTHFCSMFPFYTPSLREKCANTEFFSGTYFPVFGLNTEIYFIIKFPYSVRIQENTDQEKLRFGTLFTQCLVFSGGIKWKH